MKKVTRIVPVLMAAVLLLSSAACGKTATKDNDSAKQTTTTAVAGDNNATSTDTTTGEDGGTTTAPVVINGTTKKPAATVTGGKTTTTKKGTAVTTTTKKAVTTKSTTKKVIAGATNAVDKWDTKPSGETANLYTGRTSPQTDAQAAAMRKTTRQGGNTAPSKTGTTIYISSVHGNDNNDGKSAAKAWETTDRLGTTPLKAGDVVLFERGSLFRRSSTLESKKGVTYGSYGTGDLPTFYGASVNAASLQWNETVKGSHLWKCSRSFTGDCGLVVFNHGQNYSYKTFKKNELNKDFMMYCDSGQIFIYYSKGNPAQYFSDIEICMNTKMFGLNNNVTVENLCFKYGGAHALQGSDLQGVTIHNVEIGWDGGGLQPGFTGAENTRFGNAIEFWGQAKDCLVENCYIYQVYDTAISHQGRSDYFTNITYRRNLVEFATASIEYWLGPNDTNTKAYMTNITIENNLLRFSGYGLGNQRSGGVAAHITSGVGTNYAKNYVIRNNTFDRAAYYMLDISATAGDEYLPTFSGNTYIQGKGMILAIWQEKGNRIRWSMNATGEAKLKERDKTAKFIEV